MYINVRVIPWAKKSEIVELDAHHFKVKLLSPPIKNRANKELIAVLAKHYGVKKSNIKIRTGEHTREKLIEIIEEGPLQ